MKTPLACLTAILISVGFVYAAPEEIVKAQSDAFGKAFNACDIPAAIALYEDNATMIWPGEDEVATGKTGIKKIIKTECAGAAKGSLKQVSLESQAIGKNYIINIGMWDSTIPGPDGKPTTARVRTTELLHKSAGKWRYAIDNASIGLPPPK